MSNDHSDRDSRPNARKGDALGGDLSRFAREAESEALDLDTLFVGLEGQLARERGLRAFLRSRSTPTRGAIALFGLGLLTLWALVRHPRPDLAIYPQARMLWVLATFGVLFVMTVVLALWPLHRPAPPGWATRAALGTSFGGILLLHSLPAAHLAHARSHVHGVGLLNQLLRSKSCVIAGVVLGCMVFALLLSLERGVGRRGPLLAMASGLAANFLLQLLCPVTVPSHLLLAHGGLMMVLLFGITRLVRGRR